MGFDHCARSVIAAEAAGLTLLGDALDPVKFSEAVIYLAVHNGRIVVTGMGKSGHVAKKIVATLCSLGSPAIFVHPVEAAHGDLGMIQGGDPIIMLTKSGTTAELMPIVEFAKQYRNKLVVISENAESGVAAHADVVLRLPQVDEAAPDLLAPTVSTTMMIALGDAVAVALARHKSFAAKDFIALHPGGALGKRLE